MNRSHFVGFRCLKARRRPNHDAKDVMPITLPDHRAVATAWRLPENIPRRTKFGQSQPL
jgi:hypothetical protein